MLVLGVTPTGRHLVVLMTEADLEPDMWDIVAAGDDRAGDHQLSEGPRG